MLLVIVIIISITSSRNREFTKGGLVKVSLEIMIIMIMMIRNIILITHNLLTPPLLNPPLWTPEGWEQQRVECAADRSARRRAGDARGGGGGGARGYNSYDYWQIIGLYIVLLVALYYYGYYYYYYFCHHYYYPRRRRRPRSRVFEVQSTVRRAIIVEYVAILAIVDPCLLGTVLHFECLRVLVIFRARSGCQNNWYEPLTKTLPSSAVSTVLW